MVAVRLGVGQHADQAILKGFLDLSRPRVNSVATFVARLCDPSPWIYLAAVPILVALGRRRPRVALAVAAILIGANASTQLLKPLLAAPRAHSLLGNLGRISADSWPSGHATAAMSLALAAVLAAPARWRSLVAAVGAAFAVAVSYSFLTLGWHYPSDVFGGARRGRRTVRARGPARVAGGASARAGSVARGSGQQFIAPYAQAGGAGLDRGTGPGRSGDAGSAA